MTTPKILRREKPPTWLSFLANRLMEPHGHSFRIMVAEFDKKDVHGVCIFNTSPNFVPLILLSVRDLKNRNKTTEILAHEISHVILGSQLDDGAHGPVWRGIFDQVMLDAGTIVQKMQE